MKKILLTLTAVILILQFTPWWMLSVIIALTGYFSVSMKEAIFTGNLSAGAAWGIIIAWGYFSGGQVLMTRVAEMMSLDSPILLAIVSILLAAIIGSLSSLSGFNFRRLFDNR